MIKDSFYLSTKGALQRACDLTGLDEDEIEQIVGRFRANTRRFGALRGEVCTLWTGEILIRHHFTKKVLWTNYQ